MMVEALWRNIKRLTLHMYNRPPLDLATWAIVTKTLPPYRRTLAVLLTDTSNGRPRGLTTMQKAFKRSWKRAAKAPTKGAYDTNVAAWTCDCGAQKYHAYLLCKHLVQKAGLPPVSWWARASRYHIAPFYTVPIDGLVAAAPESKRSWAWLARQQPDFPWTEEADTPGAGTVSVSSCPCSRTKLSHSDMFPLVDTVISFQSAAYRPGWTYADNCRRWSWIRGK